MSQTNVRVDNRNLGRKIQAFKKAEYSKKQASEKAGDKWSGLSKEEQKKKIVVIWKKSMNELQKGAPGILRKTENVSKQTDIS